jgi:molybdopterin-guanine dinucleotide biosynthesis protein B
VLVEGYKNEPIPKIEIRRAGMEYPPLYLTMPYIVAVASNTPLTDCPLTCLDLDDPASIANFIIARLPA